MPVDGGNTFLGLPWEVIKPTGTTDKNKVSNPSFEVNTDGWITSFATLTRVVGTGVYGSCCGRMLASMLNASVSFFIAETVPSGTNVVGSCWVKSSSSLTKLSLVVGAVTQNVFHPGDGQWHRLDVLATAIASATTSLQIVDGRSSAWTDIDLDGAMIEDGRLKATTYIDGDQDGGTWDGVPNLSTSTRDGRDSRGGFILTLESLGLYVQQTLGGGAPPVEVQTQEPALGDGEIFQRSKNKSRVLTLMGILEGNGTGLVSFHTAHNQLLAAFLPDNRKNRGPVLMRYSGTSVPKLLTTYYQQGLEFDEVEGIVERIPLRLAATDPDFRAEIDDQISLSVGQSLSPVGGIARRLPNGTWSTLGGGVGSNPTHTLTGVEQLLDGRFAVAGAFANVGGNPAITHLGIWDPVASTWSLMGTTAPNNSIQSMEMMLDGRIVVTGGFVGGGGAAPSSRISQWTPSTNSWTTIGPPAPSQPFECIKLDPATGYLWAVATNSATVATIGGVTINGCGYFNGTTWVAASAGLPTNWMAGTAYCLEVGPDGRMYLAVSNPASQPGVWVWGGSSWSKLVAINFDPSALVSVGGKLYVTGAFNSVGGITAANVAQLSGAGVSTLGGGTSPSTPGSIRSAASTPDGFLHVGGDQWTSISGIVPPDPLATFNGSSWQPFPADPPNTATHANDSYRVYSTRDGSLFVNWWAPSGSFGTTMSTEGITNVTVNGTSPSYPVLRFDGPCTIYTVANLTTGHRINFSGCTLVASEIATLDLRPGRKTFGTLLRPLLQTVLPGSDVSTFVLAPGVNRIAVMTSAGTASMYWRRRYWSTD